LENTEPPARNRSTQRKPIRIREPPATCRRRRVLGGEIKRVRSACVFLRGKKMAMATRRAVGRALVPQPAWAAVAEAVGRRMEGVGGGRVPRYFSDMASGRVLSEEERAAENVYIQKMEREKLEKLRRKADKDKAEAAKKKAAANKGDKMKGEEAAHPI
ncbi:unnamed protein product, partial [Urochloa humidicola]